MPSQWRTTPCPRSRSMHRLQATCGVCAILRPMPNPGLMPRMSLPFLTDHDGHPILPFFADDTSKVLDTDEWHDLETAAWLAQPSWVDLEDEDGRTE